MSDILFCGGGKLIRLVETKPSQTQHCILQILSKIENHSNEDAPDSKEDGLS